MAYRAERVGQDRIDRPVRARVVDGRFMEDTVLRKIVLMVVGGMVVSCFLFFSVSCAPVQTMLGGQYGQTVPPQGPPPGDYAQPVIDQRAEYRKEMAKESREAAYTFQRQGFVKQAIVKYRESLVWWPDPTLDAYIETVEKATGLPISGERKPWTAAPRPPSKKREVVATIRNRSNRDIYILAAGGLESPESRFLPGEIREVAVLPNAYGEVVFSASRGGPLIATTSWTNDPDDMKVVPVVLFDDKDPQKLVVMTGFRSK